MTPNIITTNAGAKLSLTPIQQFFAGSTILITGATGFMGKCLMEKLLRCCPDLEKIYILVREKKGKKPEDRVEEIFQGVLFDRLRATSDKHISKVVALSGDVGSPGLGLNIYDRALLQKEVQIVFHVAATVNFNEKLRLAVAVNVTGTKEIIDLCRGMSNLKSIVHVSTAYSHCNRSVINEKFHNFPISFEDLTLLLEKNDDQEIDNLTPEILGSWPNTYTFTKAMAEVQIENVRSELPISMFRPAIVVSTWKEPIQGWIDNIYGPTGICAGAMMGVLGSLWVDGKMVANIVPVDYTINALIACAWKTGMKSRKEDICRGVTDKGWEKTNGENEIESVYPMLNIRNIKHETEMETDPIIFNYVSTVEKHVTWGEFCTVNLIYGREYPLKSALWCLNFDTTSNLVLHTLYMFFLHYLPALFIDCLAFLIGKKPGLVKIYKKTVNFCNIISYFARTHWDFHNENTQQLWRLLDSRDKEIFPFSMSQMNWLEYFRTYIPGMRKYLCKEDESTLPDAIKKQNRFIIASVCIKLLFIYFVMYLVFSLLKKICMF